MPRQISRPHRATQVRRFARHLRATEPDSKWLGVLEEVDPGGAYASAVGGGGARHPRGVVGVGGDWGQGRGQGQGQGRGQGRGQGQGDGEDDDDDAWPESWDLSGHGHFGTFLRGAYRKWVAEWRDGLALAQDGEGDGEEEGDDGEREGGGGDGVAAGEGRDGAREGSQVVEDEDYGVARGEVQEAVQEVMRVDNGEEADGRRRSPELGGGRDEMGGLRGVGVDYAGGEGGVRRGGAEPGGAVVPGAAASRGVVMDLLLAASPEQRLRLVGLVAVVLVELGLYVYFFLL
ncbi:hypothetical protein CONLIGDRAFT_685831 [Coniochaeta ligniaria NRRL 30616]|uniref:Uncharacterized protein n=1 Tax=Coniochaeta ligniaria NRRL 30616 TaxID=1408157 RepID=A0A1J7IA72_9PEZI|nr:hypothetical protein CONLIGDRAFT_685831 [Coniochaeta ligniaria NRRL 30616]